MRTDDGTTAVLKSSESISGTVAQEKLRLRRSEREGRVLRGGHGARTKHHSGEKTGITSRVDACAAEAAGAEDFDGSVVEAVGTDGTTMKTSMQQQARMVSVLASSVQ